MRGDDKTGAPWRWTAPALAGLLVAFGLLRLASAQGDFYIDEIWSYYFSRQMGSFIDAFRLNHDNNHILNTIYLYILGGQPHFLSGRPSFVVHRLLSVAAGTASLWLVWKIASRKGAAEGFIAVLLAGLSFPLVLYSSEARGYGPEIFFALASYFLAMEFLSGKGASAAAPFWAASVLAFLSHSSFIYIYAGLLIWSVVVEAGRSGVKRLVLLHAVPSAFLVAYYLFFLRGMVYGGGELGAPWPEVLLTASMALGATAGGPAGYLSLAVVAALSAAGMFFASGGGRREPVFFISAVFLVPAIVVLVMKPEFLYFRYFLVCFPFFYILAAYALAPVYRRGVWGKAVSCAAIAVFAFINLFNTAGLIRLGRGSYASAVEYMVRTTSGPEVVVGGDHDFRNSLVLGFYSGFYRGSKIVYLDEQAREGTVPEWMVRHSVDRGYKPDQYLFESGDRFTLEGSYPFSGVSGWGWYLYRRDAR